MTSKGSKNATYGLSQYYEDELLVSDTLWETISPLIPPEPPKPKGGAPRVPDRAAPAAHRVGQHRPRAMGCGRGLTCWRRLRDWQAAGVWERLHQALLDRLGRADALDWSRACVDRACIRAKRGATNRQESDGSCETGHEEPHCGRPTRHPAPRPAEPANRNDSVYCEAPLDGIRPIKRRAAAPPAPGEGAGRQCLRHPALPRLLAPSRHQGSHRPHRHRE